MADPSPLFRPEVAQARAGRQLGEIALVLPPRALQVSTVAAILTLALGAAIALGHLPATTTFEGHLVPGTEAPSIQSSGIGVVSSVHVRNGQRVERGQLLLEVDRDVQSPDGASPSRVLAAIREQQTALTAAMGEAQDEASQDEAQKKEHQALADQAQRQLDGQIDLQRQQVQLLQGQIERLQPAVARQVVSGNTLDELRSRWIDARARLGDLEHARVAAHADRLTAEETGEAARVQRHRQIEQDRQQLAQLDERKATTLATLGAQVRAPVAGTVANLGLQNGASVQAGQDLLTVLPLDARLRAVFAAGPTAARQLHPGAQVRVQMHGDGLQAPPPVIGTVAFIDAAALASGADAGRIRIWVDLPPQARAWPAGVPVHAVLAGSARSLWSILAAGE